MLLVWATDIGAYLFGRQFGSRFFNRKLAPSISPNKTIEGAIGGVVSAVLVGALFLFFFKDELATSIEFFPMILLVIFFSIVGQFGDLVESAIKRYYDVKDSGKLLPGHGGILDRFDSLLFVFPVMHLFGVI
jgi:phosphatidate cytidylyltransferase